MNNSLEKINYSYQESKKEKREKIKDDILDKVQAYINFLNQTEISRGIIKKQGYDYVTIENIVENDLINLAEKVNILVSKEELDLIENNSLVDIVGNSTMMELGLVMSQIKKLRQNVKEYYLEGKKQRDEYKEKRNKILENLKSYLNKLNNSLEKMSYYIQTICDNEKQLIDEVTRQHGFLENFSDYFKEYPRGATKLIYFKFFNEWQEGRIKADNLEAELKKLDDKYIDKEKVKKFFN